MNQSIIVFASKYVGYETLRFLIANKYDIRCIVVSNNINNYNLKIIKLAKEEGIKFLIYSQKIQDVIITENKNYDWLLNLWSPYILDWSFLSKFKHRVNIHSGLVPICRGNDNAAWCIRKRISAGVALLDMDRSVDEGDVYIQKEVKYKYPIKGLELHNMLQHAVIKLFIDYWPEIYKGKIIPKKQIGKSINRFTRKQTEADRTKSADYTISLEDLVNWMLAHDFYPGTTAQMKYNNEYYKLRIIIEKISSKT